jgi:hypothetical protein
MKMNGMYHADWMDLAEEYEKSAEKYRKDARKAASKDEIARLLELAASEQSHADGIRRLEGF